MSRGIQIQDALSDSSSAAAVETKAADAVDPEKLPKAGRWLRALLPMQRHQTSRASVTDPNAANDLDTLCVRILERLREIKNRAAAANQEEKAVRLFAEVVRGLRVFAELQGSARAGKARQALSKYYIPAELICRDALEACDRICGSYSELSSALREDLIRLLRAQSKDAEAARVEELDKETRKSREIEMHLQAGNQFDALRLGWDGDCSKTRAAAEQGQAKGIATAGAGGRALKRSKP